MLEFKPLLRAASQKIGPKCVHEHGSGLCLYDSWGQKLGMPPPIYTPWAMSLVFTRQCFSEKNLSTAYLMFALFTAL